MLSYEQEKEINNALLAFAEQKAGDNKYAYAFGMLWATLTDTQIKSLNKFLEGNN